MAFASATDGFIKVSVNFIFYKKVAKMKIDWEVVYKEENVSNIGIGQWIYTYRAEIAEGLLYRHVTEDIENEDNIVKRTETMVFVPR